MKKVNVGEYQVEFDTDANMVYVTTKMPNIEVVDTNVTVGIPLDVWCLKTHLNED